jgi:hypothetical protein
MVGLIVAGSVPVLATLGAFWKLSSQLAYLTAMNTALMKRVERIERNQDDERKVRRR